jgi:hypothetical protein
MINDILNSANLYATGLAKVTGRREQWQQKQPELKKHLTEIATYLNENSTYKQGFFVDTLHAFDEAINGTCEAMASFTLRSGAMPLQVLFRNTMGEKKEYQEQGFHITFIPTITGQVIVLLLPHQNDLNKAETKYITLSVIDEPAKLTMDHVDQIVAKGIELAYYSSFTGMSDQPIENDANRSLASHEHSPIGFKLHETTEKVS